MKFIDYLIANPDVALYLQQGLFALLSTIFEALKWTGASKVLGTVTALDGGRILRFAKSW